MAWTFRWDTFSDKPLWQVRVLVGDTSSGKQLIQDEAITWALGQQPGTYNAAAQVARMIAASFGREADKKVGDLSVRASQKQEQYLAMGDRLERDAAFLGGGSIFVGGISEADKDSREADIDRVEPAFTVGQFDNPGSAST